MARTTRAGSVFLAGLVGFLQAGCPSLPTPAEVLSMGFRSPEQCFHSFQYAVRADLPGEELRCFSQHFRSENHVSQLVWLEVREQLWSQVGMRWAVAEAEPSAPAQVHGSSAWMDVRALGKTLRLRFVREECGQTWSGEQLLSDELVDFRTHSGTQAGGIFYGQVPLPPGSESAKVTEMRLAQEWKLDAIDPIPPEH
jgi:hypothetical protein